MTLQKAIEILREEARHFHYLPDHDKENATKLGIEAMKRVLLYRKGMYIGLGDKMLGETKD